MRFTYTYRSSDGARHTAEIEAESRDAAFAKVRSELGVKPIKVVAAELAGGLAGGLAEHSSAIKSGADGAGNKSGADGAGNKSGGRGVRLAAAIVILAAIIAGGVWLLAQRGGSSVEELARDPGRYNSSTFAAYTNLVAQARALQSLAQKRLDGLELDLLSNYALVEKMADAKFFSERIAAGYRAIDKSRGEIRELFRTLYEVFPADCRNERLDAQRLYSEAMDGIDAVEERLVVADKAFRMLDANRGKWHVRKGAIIWDDAELGREFEFLSKAATASTARWERDFMPRR